MVKNNKISSTFIVTILISVLSGCVGGADSTNIKPQTIQLDNKVLTNKLSHSLPLNSNLYAYVASHGEGGSSASVYSYRSNPYNQILTYNQDNGVVFPEPIVALAVNPLGKNLCIRLGNLGTALDCIPIDPDGTIGKLDAYVSDVAYSAQSDIVIGNITNSKGIDSDYIYLNGSGKGTVYSILNNIQYGPQVLPLSNFATGGDTSNIIFDQNNNFAFFSDPSNDAIVVFSINKENGNLNWLGPVSSEGLNFPTNMVMDPNNSFLYVSDTMSNQVSIFSFNQSTGGLTYISSINTGQAPRGLAFDSSGQYLYVVNAGDQSVSEFQYNPSNGSLTNIGTLSTNFSEVGVDILVDPNSLLVYLIDAQSNTLVPYSENSNNGSLKKLSGVPTGNGPAGMVVTMSGNNVYTINSDENTISVYKAQLYGQHVSGKLDQIASYVTGQNPVAIAATPSDHGGATYVYTANQNDNTISGYVVTNADGNLKQLANNINLPESCVPTDIAIDYNQQSIFVTCGSKNAVFQYPYGDIAANESPIAVIATPEPISSIAMHPSKNAFYLTTVNNASAIYAYQQNSGGAYQLSGRFLFNSGSVPQYLTVDATGQFLYAGVINNESANTIDVFNIKKSALNLTGSIATGRGPQELTTLLGQLFVANYYDNTLLSYSINETGMLALESTISVGTGPTEVAIAQGPLYQGPILYVINSDDETIGGYNLNSQTGEFSKLNMFDLSTGTDPFAVKFVENAISSHDKNQKIRKFKNHEQTRKHCHKLACEVNE